MTPEPFPLTDLQAGYLVGASSLIELGGFHPTMYFEFDVVGLDPARAERAINLLISRHEHLRTIVLADGTQRVLRGDEVSLFGLPVVDLAGIPAETQEAAITRTRERMLETGPSPTAWPLFEIIAHRVRPRRHRVQFAMSLLLLDSRSTRQLQDEWWQLYQDPDIALPAIGQTFRECLLARVEREGDDGYAEHMRYWSDRFDSLPGAPALPVTKPLADIAPVRLTRRVCHLDRDQWSRLCANLRRHRLLPSSGMLHLFAETLGAWADVPHFCLNVLHQNWVNLHREGVDVVGQFSSTLPLEIDLRGDDFWARAQKSQRQLWKDMPHSDVSAVRITRELAARRGWTSRAAMPFVFNSMLGPAQRPAVARRPVCRTVMSNLRTPQVLIDNQLVDAADGGVDCVWDVVDDAFPPGLPEMMFDAYRRLVEMLAEPDGARARPDLLPAGHRAQIANDNTARGPVPSGRLEDGFLRQCVDRPDRLAVVTSGRALTYADLEARSRAVALWLREQGVGRGELVPVVMTKGWEQVVAILGVLRAGAAYCPIGADLPAERIRSLIEDCSARVMLDQAHAAFDAVSSGPLPAVGDGSDLAYVIYTSGSTGRPKGVMIEHRAALNTILDVNQRIELSRDDRVFGVSSLSFDLSVWDVFGALSAGATLVLPDATTRPDPVGWADTAAADSITVWNSVPALAEMFAEEVGSRTDGRPDVRAFLLSGDWIPLTLPGRLRALWPATRIIAMGGATEASIWSNLYEIERVDPSWKSIPYGKPLRNQTMRVLGSGLELKAPWAAGRIHIGGAGVARGYWRDEARTGERFVSDPATGERLYWTGDLGRYWPDGTIEFLGREDRQAKIQGFRVEPGEIEAVLRSHEAVRECVVCVADAPGRNRRLVALAVADDVVADALTAYVRARLPHYMVPGVIRVVDRLPLTANGKVDMVRALALAAAPALASTVAEEPDDPLVWQLTGLWSELLECADVTPGSDFFALGGNSLLALRLVHRLRADHGIDLGFGEIFEASTVRSLAARIRERRPKSSSLIRLSAGDGDPLVLFHPVGGSVAAYLELKRLWHGPVLAFQRQEARPGEPDLVEMAAEYREELQRVQPHGPYLLGGWSMGGVLAYEVASQLDELGQRCNVFMIDSDIESLRVPGTDIARHLEFLRDLGDGSLPAAMTAALVDAPELEETARELAVKNALLPAEVDVAGYRRLVDVHSRNLAALADYKPRKSQVPTLLFVALCVDRPDPVPAWQAVCPVLEVEGRPRDHYSIVAPSELAAIADRVRAWWSPSR